MKRALHLVLVLLLLGGAAQSAAAQNGFRFGGEVMQQALISPEQMARLSQDQHLGTARSMAMGSAFTSLGGDMSTLFINPAGLGMYRTNEFSLTPLVTLSRSENGAKEYRSNNSSRFAMANIGFALNLYEGTGQLISLNMGFAYNRIADLNFRTSFQSNSPYSGGAAAPSLLRVMAGELTASNRFPDDEGFLGYYGRTAPNLWGPMMAYNSYLLNPYDDGAGPYYEADHIGHNATVGDFYNLESRGSIGEYALSLGANIANKLYLGLSFGVQTLSQRVNLYYGEDYRYLGENGATVPAVNQAGQELIRQADYLHYNQYAHLSGVGFDLKIGAIFRPIEAVRIGVAYHSPTWYSIDHEYAGQMASMVYDNDEKKYYPSDVNTDGTWSDVAGDRWEISTPSKLMLGISYTFGKRAILSLDYERDWYNAIRVRNTPFWLPETTPFSRESFKERFAATNAVRLGGEFKATPRWALRAGVGYTSTMVREKALLNSPLPEQILDISAGMGFVLTRSMTLDVAYRYSATSCSDYRLFYGARLAADGMPELLDASGLYSTDYTHHQILLTLGFKF